MTIPENELARIYRILDANSNRARGHQEGDP